MINKYMLNKTASEPQVHGAGSLLGWAISVPLICHRPASSDQEYVIVCSFPLYPHIKWPCKDRGFFCGPLSALLTIFIVPNYTAYMGPNTRLDMGSDR